MLSTETMERIIKLLREGNPTQSVAKGVGLSPSAVSKMWCKYKQIRRDAKEKYQGRPKMMSKGQDRKRKALKIENAQQNKWAKTGVNVCDQIVRNHLNEMGFTYKKKAKPNPAQTPEQKKTRFQWPKDKHSWTEHDWMKVIFSEES